MSTIQNIQASSSINEEALLKMIDTVLSHLNQFQKQQNNQMKVLILVGVTGSGKSTIFNLLGGAKFKLMEGEDGVEELELEEISSEFSVMKGGMQSVTKEPKYYYNEEFNHLLIDFPGFQDTNGEFDQIMIQMLFYKISTQSKVKILYVVRHPELEFQDRGTNLQEFVRATFKEQSIGIENLTLLLNAFNEEYYSDEEVKTSATEQICQLYNTNNSLNIIVLRKINEKDDIDKQFSEENKRKIWEDIIKSKEITLKPIEILHTEKVSTYLSGKSFSYLNGVYSSIQAKLSEKLQNSQISDISNLQNLSIIFQELPSINNRDFVNWFEQFAKVSTRISQQLGGLEEVKYQSEEFQKIYLFFSQFSNFINGYSECMKYSVFASAQYQDMIILIDSQIEFLKENQKVEQTKQEKEKEIQLKTDAIQSAEQQRKQKQQYEQQQQQLKSETDQVQSQINQQNNEKKALENNLNRLIQDYSRLQNENDYAQRNFNERIRQEQNKKNQLLSSLDKMQYELRTQQTQMNNQLQKIQNEQEDQEKKNRQAKSKLEELYNQKSKYEQNIQQLTSQNQQLSNQIQQKQVAKNELNIQINNLRSRKRRGGKCTIF